MAKPEDFYTPAPATIFDPHRLDRHIAANHSRALAIFDIVGQLIAGGANPVTQARAALARNQPHQAAHLLHNLKASASNLGGLRVCEIIEELEQLLDTGARLPIIHNLLDSLERELALLLKAADNWLKQHQAAREILQQDSQSLRQSRMVELVQCLSESNLKALDIFSDISETLQTLLEADEFEQLDAAINELDFHLALQYIELAPRVK